MSVNASRRPSVERLEDRAVPATFATFNGGILSVVGDAQANVITVRADAAGNLQVTDGATDVAIRSPFGPATRANLTHVSVEGRGGDDTLVTDASLNTVVNGALTASPTSQLSGGAGNDTITVKNGGIVGGLAGVVNGVVVGPVVGNSVMDGGSGDDTLTSGFGNDVISGGSGNDNYLWPPGTLTDVWDGGTGNDTATIIGNDSFQGAPAGDQFVLTANGPRVLFQRTNLVQFAVDIGSTETVVLRPGAGNDQVTVNDLTGVEFLRSVVVEGGLGNDTLDASGQLSSAVRMTLLGGDGDDVLRGGAGADLLDGGNGADRLDGGNDCRQDQLIGGAGADTFVARKRDANLDLFPGDGDVLVNPA